MAGIFDVMPPTYYERGAREIITRKEAENERLRAALSEIGRLATEEGAHHFAKRAADALAGTR